MGASLVWAAVISRNFPGRFFSSGFPSGLVFSLSSLRSAFLKPALLSGLPSSALPLVMPGVPARSSFLVAAGWVLCLGPRGRQQVRGHGASLGGLAGVAADPHPASPVAGNAARWQNILMQRRPGLPLQKESGSTFFNL